MNGYRGAGHSSGGGHCGPDQTSFETWRKEIERLNPQRMAPGLTQSNDPFSRRGSVSANCHGWMNNRGPLGNYVGRMTVRRNGEDVEATGDLKKAVIGGYGLCGEILTVETPEMPNWSVETFVEKGFAELQIGREFDCDMLNIHLDNNWRHCCTGQHYFFTNREPEITELRDYVNPLIPLVVRYAPNKVRFFIQTNTGLHSIRSVNELLYTGTHHFDFHSRGKRITELAEFFVPIEKAAEFARKARPVLKHMKIYNTTCRHIEKDESSLMPYAKGKTRGFVMLIREHPDNARCIRQLIDIAIGVDDRSSYYLPYNQYARQDQFDHCYGEGAERVKEFQVTETDFSKKYFGRMAA